MKRTTALLIAMILLLTTVCGCAAQNRNAAEGPIETTPEPTASPTPEPTPESTASPTPEPTPEPTEMQRIYEEVRQAGDTGQWRLLDYDAETDSIRLRWGPADEVKAIVDALIPLTRGGDLRLTVFRADADKGCDFPSVYDELARLDCGSLELIDYDFFANEENESMERLKNVTALTLELGGNFISRGPLQMPTVKKLSFPLEWGCDLHHIVGFPNLECLEILSVAEISEGSEIGVYYLPLLENLKTVEYALEGPVTDPLPLLICEAAAQAPSIETVCGMDAATFDAAEHLSESQMADYRVRRADEYTWYAFSGYKDGRFSAAGGSGRITGKAMIFVRYQGGMDSIDAADNPDGYYGIPLDALTDDPAECAQVIVVYPEYEMVGWYTNGVTARATTTVVRIIDPVQGVYYEPKNIVTTQPPDTIQGFSGGSGEYLPEKAMPYVKQLLD